MRYVLPPLRRDRSRVYAKGWLEDKVSRFDAFLLSAVHEPHPWWKAIVLWLLRKLSNWTLHFGHAYPYILRPWTWVSIWATRRVDNRTVKSGETPRTLFLRRLFGMRRSTEWRFHSSYAVTNWATVLLALWIGPFIVEFVVDGLYAYTTYPFGTYRDVVVTQAYRNISDQSTYAVHGYQIHDGEKKELYFELGPNIWFWNLYPEFMFGQIPVLGRCTFETYGVTLRVPRRMRLFSAGSLYALNPWIVDMQCTPPTVVPDKQ